MTIVSKHTNPGSAFNVVCFFCSCGSGGGDLVHELGTVVPLGLLILWKKNYRTTWKMLIIHVIYCNSYTNIKYKTYLHIKLGNDTLRLQKKDKG